MDELTQQKADLKASIADQQMANGYRLQKSHIEYYLKNLRNGDASNREVQKKLIQTFVNAVFVFDDHLKLTYNFSGDKSTVTLQDLKDSESGAKFAYRALCSTKQSTLQKTFCSVLFVCMQGPSSAASLGQDLLFYSGHPCCIGFLEYVLPFLCKKMGSGLTRPQHLL